MNWVVTCVRDKHESLDITVVVHANSGCWKKASWTTIRRKVPWLPFSPSVPLVLALRSPCKLNAPLPTVFCAFLLLLVPSDPTLWKTQHDSLFICSQWTALIKSLIALFMHIFFSRTATEEAGCDQKDSPARILTILAAVIFICAITTVYKMNTELLSYFFWQM